MNFKALESEQKLRGGYYTQPDIALFLTRWVLGVKPRRILEPSCGDGVFIQALADLNPTTGVDITACEILAGEARKARERFGSRRYIKLSVHNEDFLGWSLPRLGKGPQFDAVLGNPPFIRYQYLDPEQQERAEKIFSCLGLPFTKHTNAWVPFVLASLAQLRPGGRMAMVVPSEILHVLHAKPLRDYLLRECSRILLLDPDTIWFDDTLQGVVLLLAERRAKDSGYPADIAVVTMRGRDTLNGKAAKYFAESDYISGRLMNGKWMLALLTATERSVLQQVASIPHVHPFGDIADVDVGIVTGANKFFLVPDEVVSANSLAPWVHPMFGRSEHVGGVIYDRRMHEENRRKGLPTNFVWFKKGSNDELPSAVRQYIRSAEAEKIHLRYKCRIRTPWYAVPSVYAAPVGMLKRSHNLPRLVLNKLDAFTTDTAYRIKPKALDACSLVVAFVNSLTALTAELEGRHYGGGVLELVPSEIEKILVPASKHDAGALSTLDAIFRQGTAPEDILCKQDVVALEPLGFSRQNCRELRDAWNRLRMRRQRTADSHDTQEMDA